MYFYKTVRADDKLQEGVDKSIKNGANNLSDRWKEGGGAAVRSRG